MVERFSITAACAAGHGFIAAGCGALRAFPGD
jgi:hypothetical protein